MRNYVICLRVYFTYTRGNLSLEDFCESLHKIRQGLSRGITISTLSAFTVPSQPGSSPAARFILMPKCTRVSRESVTCRQGSRFGHARAPRLQIDSFPSKITCTPGVAQSSCPKIPKVRLKLTENVKLTRNVKAIT